MKDLLTSHSRADFEVERWAKWATACRREPAPVKLTDRFEAGLGALAHVFPDIGHQRQLHRL
ncbi:MAG: hypothetical protein J0H17_10655, partial [Rhizobiales bacterium]|nr:hypothetical protein [Hyphomicrobiales bacterium]